MSSRSLIFFARGLSAGRASKFPISSEIRFSGNPILGSPTTGRRSDKVIVIGNFIFPLPSVRRARSAFAPAVKGLGFVCKINATF